MAKDEDDPCTPIPSFFRCPISLDVMKSPVSLCTGVTYDRASIQRWLDSGHDTCPATMQLLPSKDLVPNHTLHRLIQLWSSEPQPESEPELDLLSLVSQTQTPSLNDTFKKLLRFASESSENRSLLASNESLLDLLIRVVCSPDSDPDLLETDLKLFKNISPNLTIILRKNPDFLSSICRILKTGRPDSVIAVAGVLESVASDPESKKAVFDNEELISELLKALYSNSDIPNSNSDSGSNNEAAVVSILSTLVSLSSPRRNKLRFVRMGGVRIAAKIVKLAKNAAVELALTLLEMAAGSAEGRAAIVEETACVAAVVEKLMKGSTAANEHGVALLWSLCYFFRDRRAKEEVLRSCNNGGLGFMKVLLLMQSDCSPAVKRMCCDLLRIFRVNSKGSCTISSYDTKTTHIMPY
uniref:U-box domain-containing protein n=1 Tax=Opuntia streptacantha TaxID=393608 RepID=A0A7C9CP65_OPUST